eukprot:gene4733-4911_t
MSVRLATVLVWAWATRAAELNFTLADPPELCLAAVEDNPQQAAHCSEAACDCLGGTLSEAGVCAAELECSSVSTCLKWENWGQCWKQ